MWSTQVRLESESSNDRHVRSGSYVVVSGSGGIAPVLNGDVRVGLLDPAPDSTPSHSLLVQRLEAQPTTTADKGNFVLVFREALPRFQVAGFLSSGVNFTIRATTS